MVDRLRTFPCSNICAYLKKVEPNLQKSTFQSYHMMVYGKIKRYFEPKPQLTVGTITAKDIEKFYEHLFAQNVVANTVIHYHAILHKAFLQAFKDELIDANPFDRIDRPKKNKFHGENYSEEELVTLLELTRSDSIYPAIMLGGGLGLRRSEALGVRWSRIDWDKKTVLLDTKIIEYKANGKTVIDPVLSQIFYSAGRRLPAFVNGAQAE